MINQTEVDIKAIGFRDIPAELIKAGEKADLIFHDDLNYFGAFLGTELAGIGAFKVGKIPTFKCFYVSPANRGRGIFKKLLDRVCLMVVATGGGDRGVAVCTVMSEREFMRRNGVVRKTFKKYKRIEFSILEHNPIETNNPNIDKT